jgi:hypothetical protein
LNNVLFINVGSRNHSAINVDYGGFVRLSCVATIDIQCSRSIACQILTRKGYENQLEEVFKKHGCPNDLMQFINDCYKSLY